MSALALGWEWHSRETWRRISKRFLIAGWLALRRPAGKARRLQSSGSGDLCASVVGDTIGHFTMGCIATRRLPILLLLLDLLLGPVIAAAPQVDVTYGPLPVFELHSGFW